MSFVISIIGLVLLTCYLGWRNLNYISSGNQTNKTTNSSSTQSRHTRLRGFEVVADRYRKYPKATIQLPRRADAGSCGYDFYAPIDFTIEPGEYLLIPTDVKAYMQENEVLELSVRSHQGKLAIEVADTVSWIDSSYYNNPTNDGNIHIFLRNKGDRPYVVEAGDRVFQGKFSTYLIADVDEPVQPVRLGGLGSSGSN